VIQERGLMTNERTERNGGPGTAEGARRATGAAPGVAAVRPLGPGQRWSLTRKREVALRLLRGEPVEALSRELGVEIHRLEKWREKALLGIDNGLREREGDPVNEELNAAVKRVGELSMEVELLRERCRRNDPLAFRRSKR
jgi:transposase